MRKLLAYLVPFHLWLSHRPSMLVFLAVPIAIGWGWLGASAGIPMLLRSDVWYEQLESGVAIGLCLVHLSYVGWLVMRGARPGTPNLRREEHARTSLPALMVLFGGGTLVADPHPRTVVLVAACVLTMIGGWAAWKSPTARDVERAAMLRLVRFGERLGPVWRIARAVRRHTRRVLGIDDDSAPGMLDEGDEAVVLLHGTVLLTAWAVLVILYLVMQRPIVTAATSMCLLLAIIAMTWGWLRFWSRRSNLVLLVAALGAAGLQAQSFGRCHTLASLEDTPRVPLARCIDPAVGLLDDAATLEAWRASTGETRPILVVVATSGGGLRAAGWTMVVLERLQRELGDGDFAAHTRIITGASGGMLGASVWVADESSGDRFDVVTRDALGPLFAHVALMVVGSRGLALERAWQRNAPVLARRFSTLREGEAQGTTPSLVFSPVIVEDGRRLITSHLDLTTLGVAWTGTGLGRASRSACQWGALFPDADPTLGELVRMSASFPYVSPAVLLPTDPSIRVVDAGYYDNYGVNLATRWIEQHAPWIRNNTSGVLLVQIRDQAVDWQANAVDEPSWITRALSPWITPLSAVLAVRRAEALFRNDEALATLYGRFEIGVFETITFSLAGDVSLSWRLTDAEREKIRCDLPEDASAGDCLETDAARANTDALRELVLWWDEHR